MGRYTRREFLRFGAALASAAGLGQASVRAFADGLQAVANQQTKVLWLQGMSCSGCSVSLLNSENPGPLEILTEMISLVFHSTVGAAQGEDCIRVIDEVAQRSDFLLVVEGSVPAGMSEACVIGDQPLTSLLPPILRRAKAIVATGTCAAFGGIPAAEGNLTGAVSVEQFMKTEEILTERRLVNCPGCPVHPDSLVGTLAYLAAKGYPKVNAKLLTPDMFYRSAVHDECPRFHYWNKYEFAEKFGDEGCLFKLGCLGPHSHTSCPRRQWNGGVNWCIRAGAPCIACTSPQFSIERDYAFYRKSEENQELALREADLEGVVR
jgi:hydrogenase small subunit